MVQTWDVVLIWNPINIPDFDHYNIYRNDDGNPANWKLIGQSTKNAYTDKDLPLNTVLLWGYYYSVSAVDKQGLEGPTSATIAKLVPPDQTAPPAPTVVRAVRSGDLQSVTVSWAEGLLSDNIKGYIITRMLWDGITPTTEDIISIQSANKFVDSTMFKKSYVAGVMSYVSYKVYAYDQEFNVSLGTAANNLWIPAASNIRAIIDYESVILHWENPLPEDATVTNIYAGVYDVASATWFRGAYKNPAGVWTLAMVKYPETMLTLDGYLDAAGVGVAFVQGKAYGFSPFYDTGGVHGVNPIQEGWKQIQIPTYPTDTVAPVSASLLQGIYDPLTDSLYLEFDKSDLSISQDYDMDQDVLYWQLQHDISGSGTWTTITNTTNNSITLKPASKFAYGIAFTFVKKLDLRVRAVDRNNNKSPWISATFTLSHTDISTDIVVNDSTTNPSHCRIWGLDLSLSKFDPAASGAVTNQMKAEVTWNGIDKVNRNFRTYVLFWTIEFNGSTPVFDLNGNDDLDDKGVLAVTQNNTASGFIRHPTSTWSAKSIAFVVGVLDVYNQLHIDTTQALTVTTPTL